MFEAKVTYPEFRKLERKVSDLSDMLKYPSITPSTLSKQVEGIQRSLHELQRDVQVYRLEERARFNLLLDHLGLEVQSGDRIVKKPRKVKTDES